MILSEAEFFSRFFALSLIEEAYFVEAIANYFKKRDRLLHDFKDKSIGSFHLKRALKCYRQQRKNLKFDSNIKWNFHFLKWDNLNINIEDWINFRKQANEEDFICVLLGLVMNVADSDILNIFEISDGTLRYRYSSGLNKLIEVTRD